MDANHAGQFSEWIDVLAVTHGKTFKSEDLRSRTKAEYFDVLRSYPLDAVQSAYETLRRKMKKWPVPADWLEALPPFGSVARLPPLTPAELALNDEAERLGYEQERVCQCPECFAADCHMPPRYVPLLDREGKVIERRHPAKMGRAVLLGRWLHGLELRRWYSARAEYYALEAVVWAQLVKDRAMPTAPDQRIARIRQAAEMAMAETKA